MELHWISKQYHVRPVSGAAEHDKVQYQSVLLRPGCRHVRWPLILKPQPGATPTASVETTISDGTWRSFEWGISYHTTGRCQQTNRIPKMLIYAGNRCEGQVGEGGKGAGGSKWKRGILAFFSEAPKSSKVDNY